jgi:hypothetical protein
MTPINGNAPNSKDIKEQIELFERFLEAVKAGRLVSFASAKTCLKLKVHDAPDDWDEDREDRVNLIERTIAVLKAGYGSLTVTKGRKYFEFWVESNVRGALPPHNWASEDGGLLNPADFETLDAKEFGWDPLDLASLKATPEAVS